MFMPQRQNCPSSQGKFKQKWADSNGQDGQIVQSFHNFRVGFGINRSLKREKEDRLHKFYLVGFGWALSLHTSK